MKKPRSGLRTTMGRAALRQALESAGWRCTRQRQAVYGYLQSVSSHPTAEEVYQAVRRQLPHISLATVYNSLEALVACRLAAKLCLGEGPTRYDCRCDPHYHLRCTRTGKVRDVPVPPDPELLNKIDPGLVEDLRRRGFQVTGYSLELLGHFEAEE